MKLQPLIKTCYKCLYLYITFYDLQFEVLKSDSKRQMLNFNTQLRNWVDSTDAYARKI
jgi:hypothetical protein